VLWRANVAAQASFRGDWASAAHHRSKLKFKPTGKVFDSEMLDLWRLEGDKVVSVIEFMETALARDHLMQVK
jgi:ketosteroid isomerase-like protein